MSASSAPHSPIRVAIIDDQVHLHECLKKDLDRTPGMSVVATYLTGDAALRTIARRTPDVVVLDLNIYRSMDGALCIRELRRHLPTVQIIVYTTVTDKLRVSDALTAGAVGYLLKGEPPAVLIEAIREVMVGGAPLSPAIARSVVESFQRVQNVKSGSSIDLLTSREMEVLSATSQGARNKDLANTLGVSPETIRNHLRHIYNKLQVTSRTEAAAMYWSEYGTLHALPSAA
jgi:DNA-binding NarL/FixJ family response regulator